MRVLGNGQRLQASSLRGRHHKANARKHHGRKQNNDPRPHASCRKRNSNLAHRDKREFAGRRGQGPSPSINLPPATEATALTAIAGRMKRPAAKALVPYAPSKNRGRSTLIENEVIIETTTSAQACQKSMLPIGRTLSTGCAGARSVPAQGIRYERRDGAENLQLQRAARRPSGLTIQGARGGFPQAILDTRFSAWNALEHSATERTMRRGVIDAATYECAKALVDERSSRHSSPTSPI